MEHRACNAACAVSRSQRVQLGILFVSLKSRVWRERYNTIDDLVKGMNAMYDEYDAEPLREDMAEPLQNIQSSVENAGGNDFNVEYTGIWKRHREGVGSGAIGRDKQRRFRCGAELVD